MSRVRESRRHGSKWREQEKEWAAGIAVASIGVGAGDLVDVDPYDGGRFPEYRWRQAPEGLATRRQLRAMGLRPGGHDPVAQMTCRSGKRVTYLYRVDLAVTKLPMTLAKEAALDKAMAARQTCPRCRRRYVACLPLKTLESCLECHDGTPADPSSYTTPPAKHLLAA